MHTIPYFPLRPDVEERAGQQQSCILITYRRETYWRETYPQLTINLQGPRRQLNKHTRKLA